MTRKVTQITFGEQIRKHEIDGFVLTETLHARHLALPKHDHECANLSLTLKGSFRETIGRRAEESRSSSILVKPPGEHHANQYGEAGAQCLVIEVLPTKFESIRRFSGLFDNPHHFCGGELSALALNIYKEFRSIDSVGAKLIIEGLVLEFLGTAARRTIKLKASSLPPEWLLRARDFIHEHFAEQISLSKAAAIGGVSPSYLAQMFRKFYGCSVGDYIKRRQLEAAVRQLTETDLSLAEIAATTGFYDQSHFNHTFKLQTRMTPAEFRSAAARNK